MSDTKLLRCPFCGGEAEVRQNVLWYWVQCKQCGVHSKSIGDEGSAIEAWNTRKPMERIVEQMEKERDYVDDWDGGILKERAAGEHAAYCKAIEIVQKGGAE